MVTKKEISSDEWRKAFESITRKVLLQMAITPNTYKPTCKSCGKVFSSPEEFYATKHHWNCPVSAAIYYQQRILKEVEIFYLEPIYESVKVSSDVPGEYHVQEELTGEYTKVKITELPIGKAVERFNYLTRNHKADSFSQQCKAVYNRLSNSELLGFDENKIIEEIESGFADENY